MEDRPCMFYSNSIKLDFSDIIKLLKGRTLGKGTGYLIKLGSMPDNGCPQCREAEREEQAERKVKK